MQNNNAKNILSFLIRIGLSVILLVYLFSKIDTAKMITTLKGADFRYIYLAFFIIVMPNIILLLRWMVFIRALGLVVPLRSIISCYFIGIFFNLFLPSSTGGDLVKTVGLFKDTADRAKVVATVVCDRLSGFVAIVLVALVSFLLGRQLINDNSLLISIFVLASVSIGIALVLFNEKLYSFSCGLFNRFPKIKESFMRLHYAIALLKDKPRFILAAIGLSCLSQITLAFVFYLVTRGLHLDVGVTYCLIFVPLICVVASLPSIGGLGVRDAGTVYLFAKIGVDAANAVSISLINFLFMVIMGLLGGMAYLVLTSSQRAGGLQPAWRIDPKKV